MKDSDFKVAAHPIGALVIASRGTAVSQGYKPDVTVKDCQGQLKFILESEQKTDRKAFLGDLLKAEMHAEQQRANPELVIVMQPFGNCVFRRSWTLIPRQAGHAFRSKLDTHSGASWTVGA